MFLHSTTETTNHIVKFRSGKTGYRKGTKTVYHLQCDHCGQEFTRFKGDMSPKRLTNEYKHFCNDCKDPSLFADLGREVITENLQKRVGEKSIDHNGYVRVRVATDHKGSGIYGGAVREHILVMENHIGRPIEKGEVIHHIDGNKQNNNIKNLQLMSVTEHNACHAANDRLVMQLYKNGIVGYNRKSNKYFIKDNHERK